MRVQRVVSLTYSGHVQTDTTNYIEMVYERFVERAGKDGLTIIFKRNGYGDFPYGEYLRELYPQVDFIDVVENLDDVHTAISKLEHDYPTNHKVWLRFNGANLKHCLPILNLGGNVLVPFKEDNNKQLPLYWNGFPVADGDISQNWWSIQGGWVIGIRED